MFGNSDVPDWLKKMLSRKEKPKTRTRERRPFGNMGAQDPAYQDVVDVLEEQEKNQGQQ